MIFGNGGYSYHKVPYALPTGRLDHGEGEEDPRRTDLQLLEYRRCKLIAAELTQRRETIAESC